MSESKSSLQAAAASDSNAEKPMEASSLDQAAAALSEYRRSNATFSASRPAAVGRDRPSRGRGGGRGYRGGGGRGRGVVQHSDPSALPPVCKFFRRGICKAGATCRFRHTQEAAVEAASRMAMTNQCYPHPNNPLSHYSPNSAPNLYAAQMGAAILAGTPPLSRENSFSGIPQVPLPPNFSGPPGAATADPNAVPAYKKREFDPHKATAINLAKAAQDAEDRPWTSIKGPLFSIDVECVATGFGHTHRHRIAGRVALVDADGYVIVDEVVRLDPERNGVASYLTPISGLTKEGCAAESNKTMEEIVQMVQQALPSDAVLVGQSIAHDISWLGLKQGLHFRDSVDIARIFRQRIPKDLDKAGNVVKEETEAAFAVASGQAPIESLLNDDHGDKSNTDDETGNSPGAGNKTGTNAGAGVGEYDVPDDSSLNFATRYRVFSLRHCCVNLLDVDMQTQSHDPAEDARYSLVLFRRYRSASVPMLRAVRDSLHRAPITPSFAMGSPVVDGVCLSYEGYRMKEAARFIWQWWSSLGGGANGLKVVLNSA